MSVGVWNCFVCAREGRVFCVSHHCHVVIWVYACVQMAHPLTLLQLHRQQMQRQHMQLQQMPRKPLARSALLLQWPCRGKYCLNLSL